MSLLNILSDKFRMFKKHNFVRFCIVGFCGLLTNLAVFYVLRHYTNIGINMSAILAFSVAVTQNYYFNHLWTFENLVKNEPNPSDYARYVLINIFVLIINLLLLNIILKLFPGFEETIALALSILLVFLVNYAGSYIFVFAKDSTFSLRIKNIFE